MPPTRTEERVAELLGPTCRCGHALAVHDPCSKCLCPAFTKGKAKRFPERKVGKP